MTSEKSKIYIQFLIPIYYCLFIAKFLVGENSFIMNIITAIVISIGFLELYLLTKKLSKNSLIIIIILFLFVLSLIVIPFSFSYRIEDTLLLLNYFGIALIPVFYKLNERIYKLFAYFIILFFLYHILIGSQPDDVFSVSRNFVSVILLVGTGYHIISSIQNNKRPSPIILILSLFIAVWGVGRSGIFVFSMLLVAIPLLANYKLLYRILLILFIVIIAVYAYNYFADTLFYTAFYRIESMGGEDGRESINAEYFNLIQDSFKYFFFGAPLSELRTLQFLESNPHNSFIRLHLFYGLFGFVIVISLIINAMINYIKQRNYVFFILLFVLLFRSFVDSTSFHGPLDPLIFYLILLPIKNLKLK